MPYQYLFTLDLKANQSRNSNKVSPRRWFTTGDLIVELNGNSLAGRGYREVIDELKGLKYFKLGFVKGGARDPRKIANTTPLNNMTLTAVLNPSITPNHFHLPTWHFQIKISFRFDTHFSILRIAEPQPQP